MIHRSIIFLLISSIVFISCMKDDYEIDNYDYTYIPENDYKPNGNDLIHMQTEYGNDGMKTTIYDITAAGDGNFFFSGLINNKHTVGKISVDGQIIWKSEVGFISSGIQNHHGKLLVCGYDKVPDSLSPEKAFLKLFNGSNGNIISEAVIDSFQYVRVNGMSDKYIVGRCQMNYICSIVPFIIEYDIDASNNINILKTKIYENKCNQFFYTVKNNFIAGGIGYGRFNDFERNDIVVYSFDPLTLNIKWEHEIRAAAGFNMQGRFLVIENNELFLLGFTEVNEEVNPYNGGYFKDGFVAKFNTFTTSAEFVYKKKHKLSVYSDNYYSGYYDGQYLYAVGRMAAYYLVYSERTFSYGLISKIDPSDGSLLAYSSMGNDDYSSCFNTVAFKQGRNIFGGYTKRYYTGDEEAFKGWLLELNEFKSWMKQEESPLIQYVVGRN